MWCKRHQIPSQLDVTGFYARIPGVDSLVDFLAMHGHILGSADAKADLLALDPEHRHGNVLTNRYGSPMRRVRMSNV
jgi:hypothetical protein